MKVLIISANYVGFGKSSVIFKCYIKICHFEFINSVWIHFIVQCELFKFYIWYQNLGCTSTSFKVSFEVNFFFVDQAIQLFSKNNLVSKSLDRGGGERSILEVQNTSESNGLGFSTVMLSIVMLHFLNFYLILYLHFFNKKIWVDSLISLYTK